MLEMIQCITQFVALHVVKQLISFLGPVKSYHHQSLTLTPILELLLVVGIPVCFK